jgi:hypothetical protein
MIKNIFTPDSNTVTITIPDNYIGRTMEVLAYLHDDIQPAVNRKPFDPRQYRGTLSEEEGERYHQYLREARDSWDRI